MGSSGEAVGLSDRIDLPGPKEPEAIAALMRLGLAFVQHSVTAMDGVIPKERPLPYGKRWPAGAR